MKIQFQNAIADLPLIYDYQIRKTNQGRVFAEQTFRLKQIITILLSILFGSIIWGMETNLPKGILGGIIIFGIEEIFEYYRTGKDPKYYYALQAYRKQEKAMTERERINYERPRTIEINQEYLQCECIDCSHRYRWSAIENISQTELYIVINIDSCKSIIIPKKSMATSNEASEFYNQANIFWRNNQTIQ